MVKQNNPQQSDPGLLGGIQNEISAENAPLLEFITRHASVIAGFVLTLLLILGGMAIWNWHHGVKQKEAREELDRINMQLKGADKNKALASLAENAPDSVKLFIYMSLGQSAQENGDPVLAADAYAKAASLDGDGPLGLTAALGSASSLLMQQEFVQALALLQELEAKLPESRKSPALRQMLAEAAYHAGNLELARNTYQILGQDTQTPQGAYFRSRAKAIEKELEARAAKPAQENTGENK